METTLNVLSIGHAIELAVAPVFLLTGIGAILSVLTNRLGRSVDRYRILNERDDKENLLHRKEIKTLTQRVRWTHRAISLCTTSALLVSIVIVILFLGSFAKTNVSLILTLLFITAMLTLILGLLSFLREIYLATGAMQMERETNATDTSRAD